MLKAHHKRLGSSTCSGLRLQQEDRGGGDLGRDHSQSFHNKTNKRRKHYYYTGDRSGTRNSGVRVYLPRVCVTIEFSSRGVQTMFLAYIGGLF